MTFAVTGATGQLGRLVVSQLKERVPPSTIVAVVRNPEKAADLGVTIRQADYSDPAALESALDGITTLLFISASEMEGRFANHSNVIDAAKKAGVGRIVYTSLLRADTTAIRVLADSHFQTEEYLKDSGIDYTILRDGFYTEVYMGAIGAALEHGVIIGSAGDARFATAGRTDFAAAAVAAMTGDGHSGKTYELAGSHPFTYHTLAAEIARQSGQPVVYSNLDSKQHADMLAGTGMPAEVAQMLAGFDSAAAEGDLDGDDTDFVHLIGRKTTPLAEIVAGALRT